MNLSSISQTHTPLSHSVVDSSPVEDASVSGNLSPSEGTLHGVSVKPADPKEGSVFRGSIRERLSQAYKNITDFASWIYRSVFGSRKEVPPQSKNEEQSASVESHDRPEVSREESIDLEALSAKGFDDNENDSVEKAGSFEDEEPVESVDNAETPAAGRPVDPTKSSSVPEEEDGFIVIKEDPRDFANV